MLSESLSEWAWNMYLVVANVLSGYCHDLAVDRFLSGVLTFAWLRRMECRPCHSFNGRPGLQAHHGSQHPSSHIISHPRHYRGASHQRLRHG